MNPAAGFHQPGMRAIMQRRRCCAYGRGLSAAFAALLVLSLTAAAFASGGHAAGHGDGGLEAANTGVSAEGEAAGAKIDLHAVYAWRRDAFDWNIAGNADGTDPTILSELSWRNLCIHELALGLRIVGRSGFFFDGSLAYGVIYAGDNRDSDYASDGRRDEFSRSENSADAGEVWDVSLGLGYALQLAGGRFEAAPQMGFSFYCQQLTMTDGYQTVTWEEGPPLGAFEGLDSTYDAQWSGPFAGLGIRWRPRTGRGGGVSVAPYAAGYYHLADYHAEADWNLREDYAHPKSFEHEADGHGIHWKIGVDVMFNPMLMLRIGYARHRWQAKDGIDRVFLAAGGRSETRLNEVNWTSERFFGGIVAQF